MTQVLTGSLSEVIKQAIDAQIPPAAQVYLTWETPSLPTGPKVSPEEFERAMDELAQIGKDVPYDPTIKYDREDIYFDHD